VVQAGREVDALTAAIDLLPTLAHVCGIDLAAVSTGSPKIDGVNVWDTLKGEKAAGHPRTTLLYWDGWANLEAIRLSQWKLFLTEVKGVPGSGDGPVLYNLREDPSESKNLAAKHPEVVQKLSALSATMAQEIQAASIPLGGP
jgi:arylsulfatase A-like enzyme